MVTLQSEFGVYAENGTSTESFGGVNLRVDAESGNFTE